MYNFDLEAATYDNFYNTSPGREIDTLEKSLVQQFLKYFQRDEILEIGCGTGHWSAFFSEKGFRIHGLDISKKMLEKARNKKIPDARFTLGKAEDLPLIDQSYANVVCITSLEFVDNREKAIDEIDRVLKPGGILMIGALNENSFLGKNKDNFAVYRNAGFFSGSSLYSYLSRFGDPEIAGCVVQDDSGNIQDLEPAKLSEKDRIKSGAFLIGIVKKIR